MELLAPLQILWRLRALLGLGVLLAVAVAAAASGFVALGPLARPVFKTAIAAAEIQVDSPRSLAADLRASTTTIGVQTILLSENLATASNTALIARHAGIPAGDLTVVSSRTAIAGRSSAVARAAVDAASMSTTRHRLTVSATNDSPIVYVTAFAPDRVAASRLAAAAAPALDEIVASSPSTVRKRLEVELLGTHQAVTVTAGGPQPLVGIAAGLIVLAGWCWAMVMATGALRAHRSADRSTSSSEPGQHPGRARISS